MNKNKNKRGVSLVILVITVIVLAILAGAITVTTTLMLGETKEAKFKEEIKTIEDRINEYYVLTGTLPIISGVEYSMSDVAALNTQGRVEMLEENIVGNGETSSKFYLIDFEKIGVTLNERGNATAVDDIYVLSSKLHKVYYVRGLDVDENVYFSLENGIMIVE